MRKLTLEEEGKLLNFLSIKRDDAQVDWFFELIQSLRTDEDIYLISETDHILSDFAKGRIDAYDYLLDYYQNLDKKVEKFKRRKMKG